MEHTSSFLLLHFYFIIFQYVIRKNRENFQNGFRYKKKYVLLQPRNEKDVPVAQQVEHIPFKDGVLGSNPS